MINNVYGRNVRNTDGSSNFILFLNSFCIQLWTFYDTLFYNILKKQLIILPLYMSIRLLNKYSLNAYYVLDTVLGTRQ